LNPDSWKAMTDIIKHNAPAINTTHSTDIHPCPAPFSQLYITPRTLLDLRFCSYHRPIHIHDQESFYEQCPESLKTFFLKNSELNQRRVAFLKGDYEKAGCQKGCFWYQEWKTTGKGFILDEYLDSDGNPYLKKLWLSIGPDCNATCRYCLDPSEFHINFNTCSPSVMKMAESFVENGGKILLTGGEPFLPKFKLLPALERLAKIDRHKIGHFDIHTNATLLDDKCIDTILRSPVKTINISMDTLRPDLFEYLRRGCKFDTVWGNTLSLVRERNARSLSYPSIVILCAVMRDTYDHLDETISKIVDQGLEISLNALSQNPQ